MGFPSAWGDITKEERDNEKGEPGGVRVPLRRTLRGDALGNGVPRRANGGGRPHLDYSATLYVLPRSLSCYIRLLPLGATTVACPSFSSWALSEQRAATCDVSPWLTERVVTATVDFRHQQPKHNSGFKSNFNSGSLAEQFRQRWPEAPDGVSVSSHSFSNAAAEHDARFPPAPLAKGPGGSSERSGFNYSLKKLGPAAAPKALTSRTAHREMVPRMKLNVGPRNNMPQGSSPGLETTVNYPPHHSGFMANFKQDRLAESMQSKFLPHNAASWSAATHVDLSAGDRAGPEIPYLRGPAHSSHRSAYSRSIPSQWLVD